MLKSTENYLNKRIIYIRNVQSMQKGFKNIFKLLVIQTRSDEDILYFNRRYVQEELQVMF